MTWKISIGFILFVIGTLSLLLKLCGMQFICMRFIQNLLGANSSILYLVMCLGGFLMVFITLDSTKRPSDLP